MILGCDKTFQSHEIAYKNISTIPLEIYRRDEMVVVVVKESLSHSPARALVFKRPGLPFPFKRVN